MQWIEIQLVISLVPEIMSGSKLLSLAGELTTSTALSVCCPNVIAIMNTPYRTLVGAQFTADVVVGEEKGLGIYSLSVFDPLSKDADQSSSDPCSDSEIERPLSIQT